MDASEVAWLVRNEGMPNPNVPGWPNGDVWWVATIMAESSGNPKASNGTHFGLTQMSQDHAGTHPAGSPAMPAYKQYMFVPVNNLKGAKSLFAVQGVGAWKASELGRRKWKTKAEASVALPKQPSLTEIVGDVTGSDPLEDALGLVTDPLEGIVNAIDNARKWITEPNNWFRILQVGGGITLAIVAAAVVIKPYVGKVGPF